MERERPEAALVEYTKALDPDEPHSPLLANRLAEVYLVLGRNKEARAALEQSLVDYPEFGLTHKTLGRILLDEGRIAAARDSFRAAVEINPFDPELQQHLLETSRALGDDARASRYERQLEILRRGGEG